MSSVADSAISSSTITISSTFTVEPISEYLDFWLDTLELSPEVRLSEYNQIFQELLNPDSVTRRNTSGINTLLVRVEDWQRQLTKNDSIQVIKALKENTQTFIDAVQQAAQDKHLPILVILCPSSEETAVNTVIGGSIEKFENIIFRSLSKFKSVTVIKSKEVLSRYPLEHFRDPVTDREGHIPYTPEFYAALSAIVARTYRLFNTPPYKLIAVDADNTLWSGVCGEVGVSGVILDRPRIELQRFLLKQKKAGMLLCICSKNTEKDVGDVFSSREDMALKSKDIVSWRVNWNAKSDNLRSLAQELNLGLESFIFIDDNPAECAEVLANCPEVLTLQLPQDPAEIPAFLDNVWAFDVPSQTQIDQGRTELYQQQSKRKKLESSISSYADFLANLDLQIEALTLTKDLYPRIAQLTQRTNQFTATTSRYDEEEVARFFGQMTHEAILLNVSDRFGDYGQTALAMYHLDGLNLVVENFLLSCRVLGKGIEHYLLAKLGEAAENLGCGAVKITFLATEKNDPAAQFFSSVCADYTDCVWDSENTSYTLSAATARKVRFNPDRNSGSNTDNSVRAKRVVRHEANSLVIQRIATEWQTPAAILGQLSTQKQSTRPDLNTDFIEPRTETECALTEIWTNILRLDRIGTNDNFFDLGGQSILATRVVSRILDVFFVRLSLRSIFETPTIRQLASIIDDSRSPDKSPEAMPVLEAKSLSKRVDLSSSQERLWFLEQFHPNLCAYNIPVAYEINGELDADLLQKSLQKLTERQQVLAARFPEIDGVAVQEQIPAPFQLNLLDISHLPREDAEETAQKFISSEASTPFDLQRGPVMRSSLIKIAERSFILVLNVHHIASDGWSTGLITAELSAHYNAFKNLNQSNLPELPVQYRDYASWQRQCLKTGLYDSDLQYWTSKLEQASKILELPTDFPRPPIISYRGGIVRHQVSSHLRVKLGRVANEQNVTLFMLLFAAFSVMLHRYSSQEDILIGTPISGRTRRECDDLIGCFINTLVLRTSPQANKSFKDFLKEIQSTTLEAYEHQELPFDKLIDEMGLERRLTHTPLFQVMFVFQNTESVLLELVGANTRQLPIHNSAAKFDLVFEVTPTDEGLDLSLEFNKDLYRADTITRMLGHYENLLASICEDKDQLLGKLPLMSQEERTRVVEDFNQPQTLFPAQQCLHEIFEQYVAAQPDAVAVTFDGVELTYRELDQKSNQVAHYLIERGVGPEMIVGICLERSLELIIGLLGILKAGGAYLPLDLSYPAERVAFMLADSNATVLLTQQSLVQNFAQTDVTILALDELARNSFDKYSVDKPERRAKAEDLAYIIYTSGSTGKPKGVRVTHYNVVRLLQATEHWFGFNETDVWTLFHSYAFDFSVWEIWGALGYGGRLVIVPQLVSRSPVEFYQLLSEENVTVLNQTPSAFRQLIQLEESGQQELPLSLRYIIFGGESLDISNLKPWFDRHGDTTPQLINMYGITETTVHVTYRPLTAQDLTFGSMIGKPIPDLQIYILDENREPTPIGVPGEMYVGGAGLARDYLNRDLLTQERFITDPFSNEPGARLYRTGDLARFTNEGDIEYLGRIDQQVKLRGFRIELGEIESVISSHAAVKQCVVEVREDLPGDQRLIAYVVLMPGAEKMDTEMREQARAQLPDYMVPQHLVELDKLPLTPNGKLDRKALPAPTMQQSDDESFKAAETDLEVYLTKIWSKIFLKENIGVYDNFFEIGGHSLLAIQIVNTLSRDLETEIPLQFIFEHPCILDFAQAIEKQLIEELEKLSPNEDDKQSKISTS